MARTKQPVSINGIEFDALIEESQDYTATVPEYPTEQGFVVSDTIVLNPETLTMTLFLTDTPVTWRRRHGTSQGRADTVVSNLKSLYMSKALVTVTTASGVFTSMAITNLTISKSADIGYAKEVPITLQKVITTSASTVTMPSSYGKSGASGASAGTANTSSGSAKSGSILYHITSSAGLLK